MNHENKNLNQAVEHKKARQRLSVNIPSFAVDTPVREIIDLLFKKSKEFETINYIYTVDAENHLVGVISVKELLAAKENEPVSNFTQKKIISISENSHQKRAAMLAIKHNIKAMPVISHDNKFLGAITPDTIFNILHEQHVEDALRSGGFTGAEGLARELIISPGKSYFKKRVPWLILGLLGSIAMATVVGSFESIIGELLILAAFVPAIVYIADAVGTQTQTIFIRSLAIDPEINLRKYITREILVSSALAAILGISISLISFIWWEPAMLGTILGFSFFAAILAASVIAIFLPWFFSKIKIDPAIAAGPFATIIRDLASVFIYFKIAMLIINL